MKEKELQARKPYAINNDWLSLSKLVGKSIKDIEGQAVNSEGSPIFTLFRVVFEDDTDLFIEGEHDNAYVYKDGGSWQNAAQFLTPLEDLVETYEEDD